MIPLKANKVISIDLLHPHPKNYRFHPEEQIHRLKKSLLRFGQGRSIVVKEQVRGYLIVAGHGIWRAARELGWKELRADVFPQETPEREITAYLLTDNETHKWAEEREELFAELLKEQYVSGFDMDILGRSEEIMREFLQEQEVGEYSQKEDEKEKQKEPRIEREEWEQIQPIQRTTTAALTPVEKLRVYEEGTIRQIILILSPKEYRWALSCVQSILGRFRFLQNNTEAVLYALSVFLHDHLEQIEEEEPQFAEGKCHENASC